MSRSRASDAKQTKKRDRDEDVDEEPRRKKAAPTKKAASGPKTKRSTSKGDELDLVVHKKTKKEGPKKRPLLFKETVS